jgi:outer membrane protein assembly factor BamB
MNLTQGWRFCVKTALELLTLTALIVAAPLAHGASLTVRPQAGQPTTKVAIRGNGMTAFEEVLLRYDDAALAATRTDAAGAFRVDDVEIPASALPGRRPITALGRSSGIRASVSFLVRTNWPQFHRGPFRHGHVPHENILGPANVSQMRLLWSAPTGQKGQFEMHSSPVISDGLVYALSFEREQGRLMALDTASGALRWSQPIGYTRGCNATPAVAYGRVYAASSDRTAAHDARTGTLRWRFGSSGGSACDSGKTPTASSGRIFIITDSTSTTVEARDAASGKLLWRQVKCVPLPSGCTLASMSAPTAVADGVVYVVNYIGAVIAYSADSGQLLWAKQVAPDGTTINAAPVVEGDVIYISAHNGRLYALNRANGSVRWSAPTGKYNHSTPALADGILYVGSDGEGITAIDANTGAVRWRHSALGSVRTSPAVANGVVYLGAADGKLYALDARSGAVLHSRQVAPVGQLFSPSPAVADGVVYVSTGERLFAFGIAARPSDAAR